MTPAGVVITLAILAAAFAGGWLLGGVVADYRERRRSNEVQLHLSRIAAMRRMSGGDR